MKEFKRSLNGFSYTFEAEVPGNTDIIIKMPPISPNKRGVNDIGWMVEGNLVLYGTLSATPETTTMWEQLQIRDEVNKTISAIKVTNGGATAGNVLIRVILN